MTENQYLIEIDELIKAGQIERARKLQQEFINSGVSRENLTVAAKNFRRIGASYSAIKILFHHVFPHIKSHRDADPYEILEYCINLSILGGAEESIKILKNIDENKYPEKNFAIATALITNWKQEEAIFYLEKYILSSSVEDYQKLVGKINLAACLIFSDDINSALDLLLTLEKECAFLNAKLLLANVYEQTARIDFLKNDLRSALVLLNKNKSILKDLKMYDSFNAMNLNFFINLKKYGLTPETKNDFLKLKKKALNASQYEALRDLDYNMGVILKDKDILLKVFFGSPFESIKKKAVDALKNFCDFQPGSYIINPDQSKKNKVNFFDIDNACFKKNRLKFDNTLHRLLRILASDFYRPIPVINIWGQLNPDLCFNPISSRNSVYINAYRLQRWFIASKIDCKIIFKKEAFGIKFVKTPAIVSEKTFELNSNNKLKVAEKNLKEKFKNLSFKRKDVLKIFRVSHRSVNRLLNLLEKNQLIKRYGIGKASCYKNVFKKNQYLNIFLI